jgi:hypothetical protein
VGGTSDTHGMRGEVFTGFWLGGLMDQWGELDSAGSG